MPRLLRSFLAFAVLASWFVALAAAIALLVWAWPAIFGVGIALVLVVVVVMLRPRALSLPATATEVRRNDAPELFHLLDNVAGAVGVEPFQVVGCDTSCNAWVARTGIRRKRTLLIGLGLWNVLEPQERIFVLAHECAHEVNGDPRRSSIVGAAVGMLEQAADASDASTRSPSSAATGLGGAIGTHSLADMLGRLFMSGLSLLLSGIARLLCYGLGSESQQAELRADEIATRTAGRDNARAALIKLRYQSAIDFWLQRAVEAGTPNLLEAVRTGYSSMTDESRRAFQADEHDPIRAATDSHPPVSERRAAVAAMPPLAPTLLPPQAQWRSIADELAPVEHRLSARILAR